MSEIRFSYNPFTKDYIEGNVSHAVAIYNRGKQKQFDEYIRGIILDKVLYLRTYYPFDDIDTLTATQIKQNSHTLLNKYADDYLVEVQSRHEITESKFNVDNDLLQGIGLANI